MATIKTNILNIEEQLKYKNLGITYVSNNPDIISRDYSGNILIANSSSKLLTIEPISENISLDSVLRVIDTQFTFYSFPVSIKTVDESIDLDLDLNLQDTVFARYRPTNNQQIPIGDYSGIEFGEVLDGISQRFSNSYTISKELKNSGIDLRFRIKLQHRYDAPSGYGTAYFSLIRASEQGLDRTFRTFENTSNVYSTIPGSINFYEVQNLEIDIVIPNSEFEIGDQFQIGAKAGQDNDIEYHTINALQSYWVITDASKNVDLWNQEISVE